MKQQVAGELSKDITALRGSQAKRDRGREEEEKKKLQPRRPNMEPSLSRQNRFERLWFIPQISVSQIACMAWDFSLLC